MVQSIRICMYACMMYLFFPTLFVSLFLFLSVVLSFFSSLDINTEEKKLLDRDLISGSTLKAVTQISGYSYNSFSQFLNISSWMNFCALTRLDARKASSRIESLLLIHVYPSGITNYADNDTAQKKASTQIREARSRSVLSTFRTVFALFFDASPQLLVWISPPLFPVYTLMPVITSVWDTVITYFRDTRTWERRREMGSMRPQVHR